jgi:hypothetical protein
MSKRRIEIVKATLEHVPGIAVNMRPADVAEVHALGKTPERTLANGIRHSDFAWYCAVDGKPACIGGVATVSVLGGVGMPWLLGTDVVEKNPRALMTKSAIYLRMMRANYTLLRNYVDARNRVAIRWLERVGFEIGPPEPRGPYSMPFQKFEMKGRCDV